MIHLLWKIKIKFRFFQAIETPHVPRRQARYETRGLEKRCAGDCEELKAAKERIQELEEQVRLLTAKLEKVNVDPMLSQESKMSQQLRNCWKSK